MKTRHLFLRWLAGWVAWAYVKVRRRRIWCILARGCVGFTIDVRVKRAGDDCCDMPLAYNRIYITQCVHCGKRTWWKHGD